MRRMRLIFGVIVCLSFLRSAEAGPVAGGEGRDGVVSSYIIEPGTEFSANSYVYKQLAEDAPIDPASSTYVAELLRQIHDNYGHGSVNVDGYTPPVFIVQRDTPTVAVVPFVPGKPNFRNARLAEKFHDVPLPADFRPSTGTDREAVIYQPASGRYWEFWQATLTGRKTKNSAGDTVDEWGAAWGGMISDLRSNPGYFVTEAGHKFGTEATGLPFIAGIMSIAELKRGRIDHMLQFSVVDARAGAWSLPAQRSDGNIASNDAIPEGAIFRLPANLDLDTIQMHPFARIIARAVQRYGMIVSDRSAVVGFRAENPLDRYLVHPYSGPGGILDCRLDRPEQECWNFNRLMGFPWEKLVVLQTKLVKE